MKKLKPDQALALVNRVHNKKYTYVEHISGCPRQRLLIRRETHGPFRLSLHYHARGSGCRECKREAAAAKVEQRRREKQAAIPENIRRAAEAKRKVFAVNFLERAKAVHGDKYDYSRTVYKLSGEKVEIVCKTHGSFFQTPDNHVAGHACHKCANSCTWENRMKTADFLELARKVHGDRYGYDRVQYVYNHEKVIITCAKHGDFLQTPNNHLNGSGCKKCCFLKKSKMAVAWLEAKAEAEGIYIQHAANEGELRIRGTRYDADGYDPATNTVWEFCGDYWHGNPRRYAPTEFNDCCKKTFGELFAYVQQRAQAIRDAGYNYEELWEDEYKVARFMAVMSDKPKYFPVVAT